MRRLSALILLLPVAILFVGTVRLGSICSGGPATQCATMRMTDECGACHKKKDQPKEKGSCPCCLECPLCALVTFNPEFRLEMLHGVSTTEYAVMPDNPLSDYSQQHWKPPDSSHTT